jgi:hypothetical protein
VGLCRSGFRWFQMIGSIGGIGTIIDVAIGGSILSLSRPRFEAIGALLGSRPECSDNGAIVMMMCDVE